MEGGRISPPPPPGSEEPPKGPVLIGLRAIRLNGKVKVTPITTIPNVHTFKSLL